MNKILESIGILTNAYSNAVELYEFYQDSDLVKISVAISDLFQKYAQTSNEYDKRHIQLDINDLLSRYKNALQEINVNIKDFEL